MKKKIFIGLIVGIFCLALNGDVFAEEYFSLSTINADGDFFDGIDSFIQLGYGDDSTTTDVLAMVWDSDDNYVATAFLRDDGTRGDVYAGDDDWGCMFEGSLETNSLAEFYVFRGPYGEVIEGEDDFWGNDVHFGDVGINNNDTPNPSLYWASVDDADSYWLGIWGIDKELLGEDGYCDLSERVAAYEIDIAETSHDLSGLEVGEYNWLLYANGEEDYGSDGGALYGGTVNVTPEPLSCLLFAIGGAFLAGSRLRRKRK